ncbi:hypothetical protein QBC35DRAFT_516876 [Podospora australis]|uniref:Uncharacterized protein n=1 Tax=Podospora australis TaxID=1536484 RepID=A0AAN7AFM1_9PEZI|nr:hypothetical protein QBC35DRAFT_516876 [Podospora australis]
MSNDTYQVHKGFWTNWSYGKELGSTLTLTRSDANLLIAFVAFFLTVITTHLWAILCFALHACFSTPDPRDTVHHQRQAVLRNNPGPVGTAWILVQMMWAWRKTNKTQPRLLSLLFCSVLLAAGFVVAAGFSSRVIRDSEVLLEPHHCKWTTIASESSGDDDVAAYAVKYDVPWSAKRTTFSAGYAERCYPQHASSLSVCGDSIYVKRNLPVSVNTTAPCPFDARVCATNTSNVVLDTGKLDTNDHFGLNAPTDSRFQVRQVLHCAPLVTKGYKAPYRDVNNQSMRQYLYGGARPRTNVTYIYPEVEGVLDKKLSNEVPLQSHEQQYTLSSKTAAPYNGSYMTEGYSGSFTPISELQRLDADTDIIFLSPNLIRFVAPTQDLWYNSSQDIDLYVRSTTTNPLLTVSRKAWLAAEAASPMGCTRQIQLCFPNIKSANGQDSHCTPLSSTADVFDKVAAIQGMDNSTTERVAWVVDRLALGWSSTSRLIYKLGEQMLTSQYTLDAGSQGELPNNQWQRDVVYWNAASLAMMQQAIVSTVIGDTPSYPDENGPLRLVGPSTDIEREMCASQKIISPQHVSFSVFGLGVIGVFGLITIIVSVSLESLTTFLQKRFKKSTYAQLEWHATGTLQLQRMAQEELGIGAWSKCNDVVPVSQDNIILASLDVSDEKHPKLSTTSAKQPSSTDSFHTTRPDIKLKPHLRRHLSTIYTADIAGDRRGDELSKRAAKSFDGNFIKLWNKR